MMRPARFRNAVIAAVAVVAIAAPTAARSAGVEEFYKGRTISLIVGYSVGSGYDLYARLLARFIGRHIPGRPAVVAQNMPGAGSIKAAMYVHGVAPRDGSVIATIGRSAPLEPLLGDAQFDGRSFTWLGSIASNSSLCASWHATPIRTWQDALTKPFALAGEGSGSDPDNFARILKNVFGAKVRLVTGYPGGTEMNLAIERGEVDGRCGWSWDSIKSTRPDWLRDRKINLLAVFSLQKAADIPAEVPLIVDLASSDEQRQILRVLLAGQGLGGRISPRPAFRRIARRHCAQPSTPPCRTRTSSPKSSRPSSRSIPRAAWRSTGCWPTSTPRRKR
jgi:tripartite-type tricarboxylate transporter receptor subunit TctC